MCHGLDADLFLRALPIPGWFPVRNRMKKQEKGDLSQNHDHEFLVLWQKYILSILQTSSGQQPRLDTGKLRNTKTQVKWSTNSAEVPEEKTVILLHFNRKQKSYDAVCILLTSRFPMPADFTFYGKKKIRSRCFLVSRRSHDLIKKNFFKKGNGGQFIISIKTTSA